MHPGNPRILYAGTWPMLIRTWGRWSGGPGGGLFRSTDGGVTFEPYMNGLPQGLVVTDLKFNPVQSKVTAGTYGRGAWQVTIDPVAPIVIFDSIEQPLVEVDGDGDVNVEPGETWGVHPILRNAGGQTAENVTARLSTATPGVTLVGSHTREYGDLGPGAASPSLTAFVHDSLSPMPPP